MPRETLDSILEPDVQDVQEEQAVALVIEPFMFEMDYGSDIEVDLSSFGISEMSEVSHHEERGELRDYLETEYEIVYSENDDSMHIEESFVCAASDGLYHMDNSQTVIDSHGDDVMIHEDNYETVYCEDNDNTYFDTYAAESNGIEFCSGCEETRDVECHDFEECQEDGSVDSFDNSSSAHKGTVNTKHSRARGITSTTFSNMNGMRYTFGVELETSGGYIPSCDGDDLNASAVEDGSISGKEYVTGVLVGDSGLSMLKKVCDTVQENCEINSQCGIHVHIGGANFTRRFTIMAVHLGLMLQDEIFEMMPPSRKTNTYCKPIPSNHKEMNFNNYKEHLADLIYSSCTLDKNYNKKTRLGRYPSKRYSWLNMVGYSQANGHNTIEFRNHGASMNYDKIRNWTLICMAFVNFVENNQRRIWEAKDLPGGITLSEVLNESLGDNIGGQLSRYVNSRKDKFNGAI